MSGVRCQGRNSGFGTRGEGLGVTCQGAGYGIRGSRLGGRELSRPSRQEQDIRYK